MKSIPIPRKLLVVKRQPPDDGYNIMLEIGERTHSYQVPDNIGHEIINECQAAMLDVLVQRGFKAEVKLKNSKES